MLLKKFFFKLVNFWKKYNNPIIQIHGYDGNATHNKIEDILKPPADGYFIIKKDNRICERVRDKLLSSKNVLVSKKFKGIIHVKILSDENLSIKLSAIIEKMNANYCKDTIIFVINKMRLWLRQENLDDFRQ